MLCKNAPSISHLFYIDDSLILIKYDITNQLSCNELDTYWTNSGQLMSVAKSRIYFSPNTNVNVRLGICEELYVKYETLLDKYLDLLTLVGVECNDCIKHFK